MGSKAPNDGAKPPHGNKRKDSPHAPNRHAAPGRDGRAGKRVKLQDARAIASQPSEAALRNGELDLSSFLRAHEFEIRALEDGMARSKAFGAQRAFQVVPRGMRRRTASHNFKRVPKRLRARARREQIEDNTPTVTSRRRPRTTRARIRAETAKKLGILAEKKRKRKLWAAKEKVARERAEAAGKTLTTEDVEAVTLPTVESRPARPKTPYDRLSAPPRPKGKFKKRQITKAWLPTHVWHAKRARMSPPVWGFTIPLTPTEKVYRPTHRASGQSGTVVWDMSYMGTILVTGAAGSVEWALKKLGVVYAGEHGQRQMSGCRHWTGLLVPEHAVLGPATVIWNPPAAASHAGGQGPQPGGLQRSAFIRTHPSCFHHVFELLLKARAQKKHYFHVQDLRYEIGSIGLTGPGSTESLLGVLRPYETLPTGAAKRPGHALSFQELRGVSNPSALPRDAVLGFDAADPRLRYPPRTVQQPDPDDGHLNLALMEALATWPPDHVITPFHLFDSAARARASALPSQKYLNRRRGSAKPGEPLDVTDTDPPVPVILYASRSSQANQQGTWTLLAPWKCILPIWHSLVHYPLSTRGNPRFGGLNELRQVIFEQGMPWFPGDYLATKAGNEWEVQQRAARTAAWERRPKGKRVAWESLDLGAGRKGEIGDGHACDMEYLLGDRPEIHSGRAAQRSRQSPGTTPQATPGPSVAPLEQMTFKQRKYFDEFEKTLGITHDASKVMLAAKLTLLAGGVVTTCARIYRLPERPRVATTNGDTQHPPTSVLTGPPAQARGGEVPQDLRDQWLLKLPAGSKLRQTTQRLYARQAARPEGGAEFYGVDVAARRRHAVESLIGAELPYPPPPPNHASINRGDHPLVPDAEDLMGFVTTGAFSLSEGCGTAIGCISAAKVRPALRRGRHRPGEPPHETGEGYLCIVRNAGENVGWLARWKFL